MPKSTKRNAEDDLADQNADRQVKRRKRKNTKLGSSNEVIVEGTSTLEGAISDPVHESLKTERSADIPKPKQARRKNKTSKSEVNQLVPEKDAVLAQINSETVRTTFGPIPASKISELDTTFIKKNKAERTKAVEFQKRDLVVSQTSKVGKGPVQVSMQKKTRKSEVHENTGWSLSKPIGGTFLNIDPILTLDNEYLVLPTKHDIQIYSTATSLLVRSIIGDAASEFRTCSLSASDPRYLFVGTRLGNLLKFDWTTGRKVSQWKIKHRFWRLFSIGDTNGQHVFLAVRRNQEKDHNLLLVAADAKSSKISSKVIFQCDYIHDTVCYSQDFSTIVVCSRDQVYVGRHLSTEATSLFERQFTWDAIHSKGRIVSFDARFSATQPKQRKAIRVDVATGLQNGAIAVHNDLGTKLHNQTNAAVHDYDIGRKLHWHRTAVKAVKWSRDGNYLISGGDETVLVIWQLDTNQKQYLPHLATSILNVAVSQSGGYYALRLGDNSVMVLSTADLLPSTNITGLLVSGDDVAPSQMLLHPIQPNKMLSAVSSRAIGSRATGELTHLQVYDIDAKLQLSRQALTRNFTTAVNVGPAGQPLLEPSIIKMCITANGKWLATVDEWRPNSVDLRSMYLDDEAENASKEITLRFWAWDAENNSWIPNTRIDDPYSINFSVIAMATNPVKAEFATLGEDGILKIWIPRIRTRNGLSVKDENGNGLYTWSCSRSVQIGGSTIISTFASTGVLSYSDDGTVIAAYRSQPASPAALHLIDPVSGTIVLSQLDLVGKGPVQLQFAGRFLILLSDRLTLFDIILLQITSCLALDSSVLVDHDTRKQYLALDSSTNTIAVGATWSNEHQHQSQISIFNIDSSTLSFKSETTFSGQMRALMVDDNGNGFVVADADATIRRFTYLGHGVVKSLNTKGQSPKEFHAPGNQKGINDIFSMRRDPAKLVHAPAQRLIENGEALRGSTLDELFSNPTGAVAMSVQDLFERVAKAVSKVHVVA